MRVVHSLLVLFFGLLIQLQVLACSCTGPDKFVHSVGSNIIEVEVIDVITLDTLKNGYTATRVKVNRMLKGVYESDTLLVPIDKGFECFRGLPHQEKGTKYIITGNLLNEWNIFGTKLNSIYYGKMMALDLCSENVLFVDGDQVIGNITKNKRKLRSVKYKIRRLLMNEENYQKWVDDRTKLPKIKKVRQSMSISKFERKLRLKNLL